MKPLTAWRAAELIAAGELSSEALVGACLERIGAREPAVGAWAHLDPEAALREARARDAEAPRGPLHGVPVGVKDIVDTAGLPTEYGTPIWAGHRPRADASCVVLLRAAGAVVLGKTVTTELAVLHPSATRNPHDPAHTPGGSSSGSAAAVADGMVPLALGTQTVGSVIRPASFCGVVGYKPSFGLLDRTGIKPFAPSLDTLGGLARAVRDLDLLRAALSGRPPLGPLAETPPRVGPTCVGLCRTSRWEEAAPESRAAVESAARCLAGAGVRVSELELPAAFDDLYDAVASVSAFEGARAFAWEWEHHRDRLSPILGAILERGRALAPDVYDAALALAERCRAELTRCTAGLDVLLTPAAVGEAPRDLLTTGDPRFNGPWTLLHVPCLTLPHGTGPHGLPVGVQLVGRRGEDTELLGHALWLEERLSTGAASP